jgi:deoxyribose-phosphate aldolase
VVDRTPTSAELGARILPLIDLTSLGDDDTAAKIERLCADAVTEHGSVAAVCVWPRFVATSAQLLEGSGVGIAAVANFPEGGNDADLAAADARAIVAAGGTEVGERFGAATAQSARP